MPETRQRDVQNPHFKVPFKLGGWNGGALMNDQDSFEDVRDCIKIIVAFPVGSRQELPEFGVPDIVFQNADSSVAISQIRQAVGVWEPRPAIDASGELISEQTLLNILVRTGLTDA